MSIKPLDLTESHKSKILEMCKVLFPEYINFNIFPTVGANNNDLYYYPTDRSRKKRYISWFEASWKILNQLAIYKKLSPIEIRDAVQLYGLVCFNQFPEPHPIDYLYEMFKGE